jgi:hypothetical protein
MRLRVHGLVAGPRALSVSAPPGVEERPAPGAEWQGGTVLELAVPFALLEVKPGDRVELVALALMGGQPFEAFPSHEQLRFVVPSADFEAEMWTA